MSEQEDINYGYDNYKDYIYISKKLYISLYIVLIIRMELRRDITIKYLRKNTPSY